MDTFDLEVALLPSLLDSARDLAGRTVVVVDILRATTTITSALYHGAACVVPCPTIESARETHRQWGPDSRLGGERGGKKVEGFHHGNSPREYSPKTIAGRALILATTNGTVVVERCRDAKSVLIGAFANITPLSERLRQTSKVTILCAGTDQQISDEDVLFAGALCERLSRIHSAKKGVQIQMEDSARIALGLWQNVERQVRLGTNTLAQFLAASRGGRNLVRIDYVDDINFCAVLDSLDHVGQLDIDRWQIT